jgi:hypothetical protein
MSVKDIEKIVNQRLRFRRRKSLTLLVSVYKFYTFYKKGQRIKVFLPKTPYGLIKGYLKTKYVCLECFDESALDQSNRIAEMVVPTKVYSFLFYLIKPGGIIYRNR